ncbi:MAG: BON domain-containing protein [Cyclobacteriaceae bacterium]|nr:BON domain-containing protein [Cyclobacteriaceae bacterium]
MKTNKELQEDVMNELSWDPTLKETSALIGVTANDGVVTLSGYVDSFHKKVSAERAAQRVSGVKVVAEDIEVRLPGRYSKRTDTDIAEGLNNIFKWNSALSEIYLKVRVENGWVYLEGVVDYDYQRRYAGRIAQNLTGVTGVSNDIRLNVTLKANDVRNTIAAAFQRSAAIDSATIKVDVNGSLVTLTGTVRSYLEKLEAERAAWAAPGVFTIKNQIVVEVPVLA